MRDPSRTPIPTSQTAGEATRPIVEGEGSSVAESGGSRPQEAAKSDRQEGH